MTFLIKRLTNRWHTEDGRLLEGNTYQQSTFGEVDTCRKKEEHDMTAWSEGNVQANDITIHYYRTGNKNKRAILLLHGITDSGQCWSRVAADLEGSYDVIMTDARGHGHSGTSAADVSIALLADDAVAVIRALGLQKPYLFGHSMGAITAATVAANYPDMVRAVVLEDPPLLDTPPSQSDINKALVVTNEEQPTPFGWQWLFELRTLPREERIARGFALNPPWVQEEIIPWEIPKPSSISLFWSRPSQQ